MNNTSKNYYEILQISPNASPEIIEKAYKTLAKKYHPDMQQNVNKQVAENLMKELNEAYETLSNPQKKEIYDQSLKKHEISEEQFQNLYNENKNLKKELNNLKNKNNININNNINNNSNFQNNLNYQNTNTQQNVQNLNNYYSSYIKNLKKRGYKIKYKKTFRQHLESFISVIITIIIIFIIFQIPFIKNFFINLYNENNAFKFIIDLITGFFSAFFNLFNFNK